VVTASMLVALMRSDAFANGTQVLPAKCGSVPLTPELRILWSKTRAFSLTPSRDFSTVAGLA
jgi:hypothetical protein